LRAFRPGILPGLIALALLAGHASPAGAAAEVHKFNLVLTASPSEIVGGDVNDYLDRFNRLVLVPQGRESLSQIRYGWLFDAELRYFVRPNFAVSAGVGQLRSKSTREFSFTRSDDWTLTAEVLTAPVHVGGTYYLAPYNQGDFQARAYLGGGLLSLTDTHASLTSVLISSSATPQQVAQGNFKDLYTGDGPGWYFEVGAHMFFAVRYSVMLGAIYRSMVVSTSTEYYNDQLLGRSPLEMNLGGAAARMSFAIGF